MSTQLLNFKFSIHGTEITFPAGGTQTTLFYDAPATCQLLQDLGAIEGFTLDYHGEPVVLYSDPAAKHGYGFELWSDFLKSFPFTRRTAEIILEDRERRAGRQAFQAILFNLLSPLQAA